MPQKLPQRYDHEVTQGDSFEWSFRLRAQAVDDAHLLLWLANGYDPAPGDPINLTGRTAKAALRCADFEQDITTSIPDQSVEENRGFVVISLDYNQTGIIPARTYYWDVDITGVVGSDNIPKRITYFYGDFTIKPQQARD